MRDGGYRETAINDLAVHPSRSPWFFSRAFHSSPSRSPWVFARPRRRLRTRKTSGRGVRVIVFISRPDRRDENVLPVERRRCTGACVRRTRGSAAVYDHQKKKKSRSLVPACRPRRRQTKNTIVTTLCTVTASRGSVHCTRRGRRFRAGYIISTRPRDAIDRRGKRLLLRRPLTCRRGARTTMIIIYRHVYIIKDRLITLLIENTSRDSKTLLSA